MTCWTCFDISFTFSTCSITVFTFLIDRNIDCFLDSMNCIKEIMKNIEDAKTYGIPVAQLLLNMKAFCEKTMLSPKADDGRKKQMAEWRKLLGYSDEDLDEDD